VRRATGVEPRASSRTVFLDVKVFFDTNVLIAAFATRGLCADMFAHVLLEHDLVVGEVTLTELRKTLRRKLKLPKKTIDEIEA
jgi:predicted nucleic acid-binding protein